MKTGKITLNRSFIGVVYDTNIFIKIGKKNLASQILDNDIVNFEIENNCAIITNIVERKEQIFIGIITKTDKYSVYLNLPILNPISSIKIIRENLKFQIKEGDTVIGRIDKNICEILKVENNDRDLIEYFYEKIRTSKDIKFCNKYIEKENYYRDLTHLDTFHVDPEGCEDIDDFLSIDKKNNTIYIHIIDITYYIKPGTEDDKEGMIFGNTWYFPDFTKHLYKKYINYNYLNCITLEINFVNEDYKVDLYKSKVKCCYDFIYNDLQLILDKKIEHKLSEDIIWSLKKLETIYIPISSNSRILKWKCSSKGFFPTFEEELLAHRYISGWMIFYNSWLGKNLKINENILPQRHHPSKFNFEIKDTNKLLPLEVQHILTIKKFRNAEYKQLHNGHFGLNLEFYTHATSPLRRYFDRLIQYIITYGKDFVYSAEVIDHLNDMEKLYERVCLWYTTRIMNKYIIDNPDNLYECYIIEKYGNGTSYYIYDLKEIIFDNYLQDKEIGDKIITKLNVINNKISIFKV
jgi:ribonuclease R